MQNGVWHILSKKHYYMCYFLHPSTSFIQAPKTSFIKTPQTLRTNHFYCTRNEEFQDCKISLEFLCIHGYRVLFSENVKMLHKIFVDVLIWSIWYNMHGLWIYKGSNRHLVVRVDDMASLLFLLGAYGLEMMIDQLRYGFILC